MAEADAKTPRVVVRRRRSHRRGCPKGSRIASRGADTRGRSTASDRHSACAAIWPATTSIRRSQAPDSRLSRGARRLLRSHRVHRPGRRRAQAPGSSGPEAAQAGPDPRGSRPATSAAFGLLIGSGAGPAREALPLADTEEAQASATSSRRDGVRAPRPGVAATYFGPASARHDRSRIQ